MNINILNHKDYLGKSPARHNEISAMLKPIIEAQTQGAEYELVEMYNLLGEKHTYDAGNAKRLVIYVNGTSGDSEWNALEKGEFIAGIETPYQIFLSPKGDGHITFSDNGLPIAEYRKQYNELNILFQLDEASDDTIKAVFTHIMTDFHTHVVRPKLVENSWKFTHDRTGLTTRFVEKVRRVKEQEVEHDRRAIEERTSYIRDYTSKIKRYHDDIIRMRNNLENADRLIKESESRLLADLDSIIQIPKVSDLQIKNDKFLIFTDDIYAHHDKTGKRYYIGKFRIELTPENTDVRWFNLNNKRRGYWGMDNHPHVRGNGTACMGNISSTLAELSSRMELYALVIMAIDFIENVNTEDPAGRKIVMWDKVDDEGNIISTGGEESNWTCPNCGGVHRGVDDDDHPSRQGFTYYDHETDLFGVELEGCTDCLTWMEGAEEYVDEERNNPEEDY